MPQAIHRIRRLRWLVRSGSTAEAFAARKLLRERWEEWLLPVLEKAFDDLGAEDRTIRIPKLEIRISAASGAEWPEILPGLIRNQLREQLRSLRHETAPVQGRSAETAAEEALFGALLHYLRTGSTPWLFAHAAAADIAADLRGICRTQWPVLSQHLRTRPESREFYFRLVQLIAEESLSDRLVEVFDRETHVAVRALARALPRLLEEEGGELTRHERLTASAALAAEALGPRHAAPDFPSAIGKVLPPERVAVLRDFLVSLPDSAAALFAADGEPEAVPPSGAVEAPDRRTARALSEGTFEKPAAKDEFPLTVNHAGLAILHPYLPRFFENTGLRRAGGFELSSHVLPRAAALLHHLATGRETVREYELGFIKILLGLRPESPLPVAEGLIGRCDREEAETLLQSVIGHWNALKNTSVQGLRSSFLERNALIREDEAGWRLQVESRPFDMLLDRLPWSAGIVKTPWMTKPVYVEWPTS